MSYFYINYVYKSIIYHTLSYCKYKLRRIMNDYFHWTYVRTMASYLSKRFVLVKKEFLKVLSGSLSIFTECILSIFIYYIKLHIISNNYCVIIINISLQYIT